MGKKELVITCVLKSGKFNNKENKIEYRPDQVRWLKRQFDAFLPIPHTFVCMSDMNISGINVVKLKDGYPGWWSKLELFREFNSCFYVDLDTVLLNDISELVKYPHSFTVLNNLSSPTSGRIGSGIMAWNKDLSHLYQIFSKNPHSYMSKYVTSQRWGDQGFIQDHQPEYEQFQTLFPGSIKSYKKDSLDKHDPADCKIVCFHGIPKPWETTHDWVPKMSIN